MAANNSRKATEKTILGKIPVALHQHYDWLVPASKQDPNAQFASKVVDVARGSGVIASILCTYLVDSAAIAGGENSVQPLFSPSDIEALARLAAVSLDQLFGLAERQVDRLNDAAQAGSQV